MAAQSFEPVAQRYAVYKLILESVLSRACTSFEILEACCYLSFVAICRATISDKTASTSAAFFAISLPIYCPHSLMNRDHRHKNLIPRSVVKGLASVGRRAKGKDRPEEYSYLLSVPFSPPAAKTAMAATVAMARAENRTNFTIIVPLVFYGLGGEAGMADRVPLPGASTWPDV
jgi:hypothetical protein